MALPSMELENPAPTKERSSGRATGRRGLAKHNHKDKDHPRHRDKGSFLERMELGGIWDLHLQIAVMVVMAGVISGGSATRGLRKQYPSTLNRCFRTLGSFRKAAKATKDQGLPREMVKTLQ